FDVRAPNHRSTQMCYLIECSKCKKQSWGGMDLFRRPSRRFSIACIDGCPACIYACVCVETGCGRHLESTFADVSMEDRCWCGWNPKDLEAQRNAGKQKASKTNGPFPKAATSGCTLS